MANLDDALCRQLPLIVVDELFFPEHRAGKTNRAPYYAEAKAVAICQKCPVKDPCLVMALNYEMTELSYGVYGGLTAQKRKIIINQIKRSQRK